MQRHVQLTSDIIDQLPDLRADPHRLQQVLTHVIGNALKFTPSGGEIHVALRRSARHAVLEVHDSGCGIGSELMPNIFEAFAQRPNRPAARGTGLGLGLHIARHLVELHGGTLTAQSAGVGQGTTFTLKLPLSDADIPG
jgi:signal transduction histidine kinase